MIPIKQLSLKIVESDGPLPYGNYFRISAKGEFLDGTWGEFDRLVLVSRHLEDGLLAQTLLQSCSIMLKHFSDTQQVDG
jgi:hypothetical protein